MKKIALVLAILLSVGIGGYVGAKSLPQIDIVLPEGKAQDIYSKILNNNKFNAMKFQDGNNTCYIVFATRNGNTQEPTMSCVKN